MEKREIHMPWSTENRELETNVCFLQRLMYYIIYMI